MWRFQLIFSRKSLTKTAPEGAVFSALMWVLLHVGNRICEALTRFLRRFSPVKCSAAGTSGSHETQSAPIWPAFGQQCQCFEWAGDDTFAVRIQIDLNRLCPSLVLHRAPPRATRSRNKPDSGATHERCPVSLPPRISASNGIDNGDQRKPKNERIARTITTRPTM